MKAIKMFLAKRKFPKKINGEWFAYNAVLKDKGKEQLPVYFDKDKQYVEYKIDDIVPVKRIENLLGFYKIIKIERPYGDYAGWDDGRKYDLLLHHVEEKPRP